MMKSIEVVAAVIHKGDKIFATQRGYGEWKDWWEFPGGKIEAGESPEAALTREIREELNAEIRIDRYLATVDWDYPKFHLTLHCYVCSLQTGAMHLNEHEAACWLRADELHRVQWLPADEGLLPLIEKQMKQSSSPMKQNKPAMRADFVGSFLRPESVKKARVQAAAGEITPEELKAVEDEAIRTLVQKQKELGFKVVTDGEFRRQAWHLDFMWGFEGVGHSPTKTGLPFHGEQAMIDDTYLTGKVSLKENHPFIDHFRFVNALAGDDAEAKLTIPAPAQFLAQMVMPFAVENTRKYYADNEELMADLASAYRLFIQSVYAAGCRRLQFDDCTWGMLVDPVSTYMWGTDEEGLKAVQEMNLRINNMALEGKPADMFINTHVCRGNYHSTYANSGAYDRVAEVLFERENVDAYYLEFDDSRSGGFAPLSHVSGDKMVVLGLITTKSPALEFKSVVKDRIKRAAQYIPLERLCLSPQCGFASCEIGNKLTEEEQWAKLKLVQDVANEVWGI